MSAGPRMDAEARELAAQWYPRALHIAREQPYRFFDDPGLELSIAGEATCQAATQWIRDAMTGTFHGFLTVVIRRRICDVWRRHRGRTYDRPFVVSADALLAENPDQAWATDPDPNEHTDLYLDLEAAASDLSDRHRAVLGWSLSGWTLCEMGEALGVTESGAHRVLARARQRLRGEAS